MKIEGAVHIFETLEKSGRVIFRMSNGDIIMTKFIIDCDDIKQFDVYHSQGYVKIFGNFVTNSGITAMTKPTEFFINVEDISSINFIED